MKRIDSDNLTMFKIVSLNLMCTDFLREALLKRKLELLLYTFYPIFKVLQMGQTEEFSDFTQ